MRALSIDEIAAQADAVLQPDHMIWVVVGDRAKIEQNIEARGIGDIRLIDADGNPAGE